MIRLLAQTYLSNIISLYIYLFVCIGNLWVDQLCHRGPILKILRNCFLLVIFFFFFWPLPRGMQDPWFPDQGSNPCPLQWKHGTFTTGPPGKSLVWDFVAKLYYTDSFAILLFLYTTSCKNSEHKLY